jgi:hypothetical protein
MLWHGGAGQCKTAAAQAAFVQLLGFRVELEWLYTDTTASIGVSDLAGKQCCCMFMALKQQAHGSSP